MKKFKLTDTTLLYLPIKITKLGLEQDHGLGCNGPDERKDFCQKGKPLQCVEKWCTSPSCGQIVYYKNKALKKAPDK